MLFVRGDRTVVSIDSAAKATTLRSTGKIFETVSNPPPVTSIGAGKFESIGNPYPSAIDFSNDLGVIKSANIQRVFYVWDPLLGNAYGGYQTFIKGSGADYTVLPGGGSYGAPGSVQNKIQSGQAFFVKTFGGTGTVSFTENAKTAGSQIVTRPGLGANNRPKQLITSLYAVNTESNILLDATLIEFDPVNSNALDFMDALKMDNLNEGIGTYRDNKLLAVERRGAIRAKDTVFYKLDKLRLQQYEFEFSPAGIAKPGLSAFLIDKYLLTSHSINLNTNTKIRFQVVNDPGSYSNDRFILVFKQSNSHVNYRSAETKKDKDQAVVVYPNPVTNGTFMVAFHNQPEGKYRLQLKSNYGAAVFEKVVIVSGSHFNAKVRLPLLAAGNYTLTIMGLSGPLISEQIIIP